MAIKAVRWGKSLPHWYDIRVHVTICGRRPPRDKLIFIKPMTTQDVRRLCKKCFVEVMKPYREGIRIRK